VAATNRDPTAHSAEEGRLPKTKQILIDMAADDIIVLAMSPHDQVRDIVFPVVPYSFPAALLLI
jgi:hypothetical protein